MHGRSTETGCSHLSNAAGQANENCTQQGALRAFPPPLYPLTSLPGAPSLPRCPPPWYNSARRCTQSHLPSLRMLFSPLLLASHAPCGVEEPLLREIGPAHYVAAMTQDELNP